MKFYGITLIKNEADIIEYSLNKASEWADKLFVFDNGSTDGTWEIVQGMKNEKVIPVISDPCTFKDSLRGNLYNVFKDELEDGDWVVIQDGDEFFFDDPREFVKKVSLKYHFVGGKKIDYFITKEDIKEFDVGPKFENNLDKIKYYNPESWSEPRLIRYRKNLEWGKNDSFPKYMGIICPDQIRIKHYPQRSPEQMKVRHGARKVIKSNGGDWYNQWEGNDWEDHLRSRKELESSTDPEVVFRNPTLNNHLHSPWKLMIKRIMHGVGLWP